ncbi:hypothetical protein PVAND_004938 [Polypedilum vanderplanki]|uniref:Protein inscuteable homologue C-terminal domain-containing protein n=1 Tax=Polypedilum vanderplanki TaxID=319348 RepID=A0A9J6BZJ8_POLVA|nr:hypothetical protein PVAND_004938 [Polypedilum vanderplanki]
MNQKFFINILYIDMQSNYFQRSQSKVWFGSQQHSVYDNFYSLPNYYGTKNTLQSITEQEESFSSPKNENDERKRSFLIWGNRHSPSSQSHKSQDSGFSDTENSPQNAEAVAKNQSIVSESQSNQSSPSASSRIATPPTVIRRPNKSDQNHIYEEISSARRISFSAPSSPLNNNNSSNSETENINNELKSQIDGINFNTTSPMNANDSARSSCRSCKIKRSRVITKHEQSSRSKQNLSLDSNNNDSFTESYNNETVYFGCGSDSVIMEEKSLLLNSPSHKHINMGRIFPTETSTPKKSSSENKSCNGILETLSSLLPQPVVYKNELLNGHFESVQSWIDGLKYSISSEVMSTLQSKSIETENFVLTPTYAFKLIRSIQNRALALQREFEIVETCENRNDFLPAVQHLADLLIEFISRQEQRRIYFKQNQKQYKKLCENLESLREMLRDLKNICSKIDVDDLEEFPICDDMQLIKRYFVMTIKILFKVLVSAIVENIEHAKNEIMLRSNITHIANLLSGYSGEYEGTFASLNDAFVANSLVRVLLLVCLENKSSWMRALALRTLALVCVSEETIQQFEINSGFEILRDIIIDRRTLSNERLEQEVRESVSLLASITAPWQSSGSCNNFKELKDYAEDYIEGISKLLEITKSPQTILICVAVLNNLSHIESSSIYSLISHQTLSILTNVFAQQVSGEYTIFFVEQTTSVIFNMSQNKKSHYHLTSRSILNFIFDIFLTIHHLEYDSQSQSKAKRKSIKNILNTLKQLELTSSSYEITENIRSIITKIHRKLFEMDFGETTAVGNDLFEISRTSKNVTKISIYSQETFL